MYKTSLTRQPVCPPQQISGGDEAMLAGKQAAVVTTPLQIDHDLESGCTFISQ